MKNTTDGRPLKDDVSNYDENAYPKPTVTADVIVCETNMINQRILLVKRKNPPFRDCWALPGGFLDVEKKENLEQTALRELREETNIERGELSFLGIYSDPDRDPRTRVITAVFYDVEPSGRFSNAKAGDDAKEIKWFPLDRLPDMAFDHGKIVEDFIKVI